MPAWTSPAMVMGAEDGVSIRTGLGGDRDGDGGGDGGGDESRGGGTFGGGDAKGDGGG